MDDSWIIDNWPTCQFHVFLSHVREDTETLIKPLAALLEQHGVIVWGDWKHFGEPRDSLQLLRDKLLKARHVVYILTENALNQGRGWLAAERAYAALIQSALTIEEFRALNVELLLLTLSKSHDLVSQSIWYPLLTNSNTVSLTSESQADLITSCCRRIVDLVRDVERNGVHVLEAIQEDPMLSYRLRLTSELEDRLTGAAPAFLPAGS
jgi:hypothetical protein